MDYIEYKKASDRHLETCLRLREVILATYSKAILNVDEGKKKNELLANIYYLSGYVIECIVSYSILKFIDFDTIKIKHTIGDVEALKYFYTNAANKNYGVDYHYSKLGPQLLGNCRWAIYCKGHNLANNLDFFTNEANLTGLGIKGIDVKLSKDLRKMLSNWSAQARYTVVSQSVTQHDKVFDFLDLAQHIHVELFNQSNKF